MGRLVVRPDDPEQPAGEEPPRARSPLGVGLLGGLMLALLHTVGVVVFSTVSATLSPGAETAGGGWDVLVWALGLVAGVLAARPVLRRSMRPAVAGAVAGLVAAAAYAVPSVLGDAASVPWFAGRVGSLAVAGLLVGLLSPAGPPEPDPAA